LAINNDSIFLIHSEIEARRHREKQQRSGVVNDNIGTSTEHYGINHVTHQSLHTQTHLTDHCSVF